MLVPMYVHFAGGSPQRGLTRRLRRGWWGCRPRGEKSFLSKRKKGPKKAGGTATPEAARPAARYSQISAFRALPCPALVICSGLPVANCLRQLCPLGTRFLSAQASVCGSRTVGRPEFIRVVQFRPKGRNSLTTFREQTALRGCPRARGVRCRIAPYRSASNPPCGSFWAAPKAPLGPRFPSGQFAALTRREKGFDCPF